MQTLNPFTRRKRLTARVEKLEQQTQELRKEVRSLKLGLQAVNGHHGQVLKLLETRLDALERAHWHDGIENNCTECREVWNK